MSLNDKLTKFTQYEPEHQVDAIIADTVLNADGKLRSIRREITIGASTIRADAHAALGEASKLTAERDAWQNKFLGQTPDQAKTEYDNANTEAVKVPALEKRAKDAESLRDQYRTKIGKPTDAENLNEIDRLAAEATKVPGLKKHTDDLSERLREANTDFVDIEDALRQAENELEQIEAEHQICEPRIDAMRDRHKQAEEALQARADGYERQANQLGEENARLNKKRKYGLAATLLIAGVALAGGYHLRTDKPEPSRAEPSAPISRYSPWNVRVELENDAGQWHHLTGPGASGKQIARYALELSLTEERTLIVLDGISVNDVENYFNQAEEKQGRSYTRAQKETMLRDAADNGTLSRSQLDEMIQRLPATPR